MSPIRQRRERVPAVALTPRATITLSCGPGFDPSPEELALLERQWRAHRAYFQLRWSPTEFERLWAHHRFDTGEG